MRSLALLALVACLALAVGAGVRAAEPGFAALSAPRVGDVPLLQMDSQARSTVSAVATLETELAAALASQHALESELSTQTTATVGAQADADSEQVAEMEEAAAQQHDSET